MVGAVLPHEFADQRDDNGETAGHQRHRKFSGHVTLRDVRAAAERSGE